MKFTMLIATFIINITFLHAQGSVVPTPDFTNVPSYYIKNTTKLHKLSKDNIGVVGKIGKTIYELQGAQSSVQIKSTDEFIFIVKAGDMDPSSIITLYKMTQKKKSRRATIITMGFTSGKTDTKDIVKYNLVKIADKIYRIVPDSPLQPGEYMFMAGGTPYSFGIN